MASSTRPPARIRIHDVWPAIDCGRYAPKRTVGDRVDVWAEIVRDGHEELRAAVRYRPPGQRRFREAPLRLHGSDRWTGSFEVSECGRYTFTIEAWVDRFASWREELRRKLEGDQTDFSGELAEGLALLEALRERQTGDGRRKLDAAIAALDSEDRPQAERVAAALDPKLDEALARNRERWDSASLDRPLQLDVDRERASFGSWYELFPRSFGGFAGVERMLPRLAELGFDVIYLPPIHPIGRTHRKGPNNAPTAGPDDPGSPWAIGSELGGHTAVDPSLGTLEDLDRLVAAAAEHGLEIALDFAIQCSPDHPWLKEHPEWFHRRPDGTLKYAENPPKRYQDIYNVNFDSEDWRGLWDALLGAVVFWVERGVRVFRVDNPHTKPIPFWEWLIAQVRREHPDVVFLAEAFTRPALMATLAKAGFSQSYTYFTWKNTKAELVELMAQHVDSDWPQFLRPNFFANTPDILHEYLQRGGRPAFEARLVLAATLSPSYGIYSGFEHGENVPVREGSEEYLGSEKYEVRQRDLDGPLLPLIGRVNAIRRENPALRRLTSLRWLETETDQLIAYLKLDGDNALLVCVNLDPAATREGVVVIPAPLGLPPVFTVLDLLTDTTYNWRIGRNYVQLGPGQSHIMRVER